MSFPALVLQISAGWAQWQQGAAPCSYSSSVCISACTGGRTRWWGELNTRTDEFVVAAKWALAEPFTWILLCWQAFREGQRQASYKKHVHSKNTSGSSRFFFFFRPIFKVIVHWNNTHIPRGTDPCPEKSFSWLMLPCSSPWSPLRSISCSF